MESMERYFMESTREFSAVRKIETFMHESSFNYTVHVMQNAYL